MRIIGIYLVYGGKKTSSLFRMSVTCFPTSAAALLL